ncbi:hypothetical protein [Flagellimonas marinaquae]
MQPKPQHRTIKQITISLLFIGMMMISNLRFSSMYVYYSLDREGFIEQLCENKDKPELNCDGKCMLSQMLNAQSEDDKPMPTIGWEEVLVFLVDLPNYSMSFDDNHERHTVQYVDLYTYHYTPRLIKPPMI